MAWVGFITLLTIYWCIFLFIQTTEGGWFLICGWLLPIFFMAVNYQDGMQINGLMVLLCVLEFFFCRAAMDERIMWNIHERKKKKFLFGFLYFWTFLFLFYSLSQAQIQGYILNLQGWGSTRMNILRIIMIILPLLVLNYFYTNLIYTAIDRVFLGKDRKQELILLSCKFFEAGRNGGEKHVFGAYFLEGIHNGVTYHFRITKRTWRMLKKETTLRLQVERGRFGGLYVRENPCPEDEKKIRKRDREDAKLAILFCMLVSAFGVWLFWFR